MKIRLLLDFKMGQICLHIGRRDVSSDAISPQFREHHHKRLLHYN